MKEDNGPSIKEKILFWIVLSAMSVFFAEVISCSQPFALVHPLYILLLIPLYGIHTLLLAALVFRGNPTFSSLFTAGCIFGLYEAYITKVLFDPHWGRSGLHAFGVDILWILILVLWWHVFFAFIIPLFISERIMTRSNEIASGMPKTVRKVLGSAPLSTAVIVVFIIWVALFMGGNMPTFWLSPIAIFTNLIVVIGLVYLFRKLVGKKYSLRSLLPEGKEFWILFVILIAIYIVLGILFDPSRIPGLTGQLIILALYTVFISLLILNISASRKRKGENFRSPKIRIKWWGWISLFLIFSLISLAVGISGIGIVFILISFLFGIILGSISFVYSMIYPVKGMNKLIRD